MIVDVMKTEEISDGHFDLIAGTAWLLSRPEFDQTLDTLFIDEAGQVSIANVVAMGVSARNIVRIGDQMQLGQPMQGACRAYHGTALAAYCEFERQWQQTALAKVSKLRAQRKNIYTTRKSRRRVLGFLSWIALPHTMSTIR
jgi:hypothetical protein